MRLLIITPAPFGSTKGNRITAERWGEFLRELGHDVCIAEELVSQEFDGLIALHATRSHDAIVAFQNQFPGRPVILCLTGTDLHADLQHQSGEAAYQCAVASINRATRLVLLEPAGAKLLPNESLSKEVVILQSAIPVTPKPLPKPDCFEISLVGHLRDEKDPFLSARAARLLPVESQIEITHLGAALQEEMEQTANEEMNLNERYRWLNSVSHQRAQEVIARSRLMVLTSKIEGAPSAISEAIVNSVPILATRIPATEGLLGEDYAGLFPIGDVQCLAELMNRAESDDGFLADLQTSINRLAPQFAPSAESATMKALLESVDHEIG